MRSACKPYSYTYSTQGGASIDTSQESDVTLIVGSWGKSRNKVFVGEPGKDIPLLSLNFARSRKTAVV